MKRWYVAQVYAGYEEAIKTDLLRHIAESGLQDYFGEILIPSAKSKQMFDVALGTQQAKNEHQLFPGYLLIEMEAMPETIRLVTSIPRISRFLGGTQPAPISQKEIERIKAQIKGEVAVAPKKSEFSMGSEIEIKEGPFAGFMGIIDKIDEESEKLTVMVSIFGRMTPVELEFDQVKR
jgi:transcription termination/antitermination protein NusG